MLKRKVNNMECKETYCVWQKIKEDDFCQEHFTDLFNNILESAIEYGSEFPNKEKFIYNIDIFLKWLGLEKQYIIYAKEYYPQIIMNKYIIKNK